MFADELEIDHLGFLVKSQKFFSDLSAEKMNVNTNDHECRLGKWLFTNLDELYVSECRRRISLDNICATALAGLANLFVTSRFAFRVEWRICVRL